MMPEFIGDVLLLRRGDEGNAPGIGNIEPGDDVRCEPSPGRIVGNGRPMARSNSASCNNSARLIRFFPSVGCPTMQGLLDVRLIRLLLVDLRGVVAAGIA